MMHTSVLLKESIQGLNIVPDGIYFDCTYGRGGHAQAILSKLNAKGKLVVIDCDHEAIAHARANMGQDARVVIVHERYSEIANIAKELAVMGSVHGVLFDLGVSSPQLDDQARGFSFMRDGPLDMRMDHRSGISAKKWLEEVSLDDLYQVIKTLGEEKFAYRIAKSIVAKRKIESLETTGQLASMIEDVVPVKENKHPATRTFQAIRMYVNQELEHLQDALHQSVEVLMVHGRLVVISFHSIEHRYVRKVLKDYLPGNEDIEERLVAQTRKVPRLKRVSPAKMVGFAERKANHRSRSAQLRIVEKIR